MIRAGRRVVTQAHLAQRAGSPSLAAFRMARRHLAPAHPAPVSSEGAQRLLWDDEQTAAYYAGEPVPALPTADSDEDLLDKYEAAEAVGVHPETWRDYQKKPARNGNPPAPVSAPGPLVRKGGKQQQEEIPVDHWRRGELREWIASRPGLGSGAGGRPKGVADLVDREEIVPRAAALLAEKPGITGPEAADTIGVALATAQNALATARADAVEHLLAHEPGLTAAHIADRLNCPRRAVDRALDVVAARRRAAQAEPYLSAVADQLTAAGCPVAACTVRVRPGGTVAAALRLETERAGVRHLLWDERYGWRTAPQAPKLSRSEVAPPTGAGIRYLARAGLVPDAHKLGQGLLRNPRSGSSSATVYRNPGEDLTRHLPQHSPAGSR